MYAPAQGAAPAAMPPQMHMQMQMQPQTQPQAQQPPSYPPYPMMQPPFPQFPPPPITVPPVPLMQPPILRPEIPGVPYAAPASDPDAAQRIEKLAEYVARNEREGKDFEATVKAKEQDNPAFAFLFGGEHSKFYQWALFCARRSYSKEETQMLLQNHKQTIDTCAPGTLDMTIEESKEFNELLDSNRGSAKDVKTIRSWIIERAHCATASAVLMRKFLILKTPTLPQEDAFMRTLHSIYVMNDVFFNCSKAVTHDVTGLGSNQRPVDVIGCMFDQIAPCFTLAYRLTSDEQHRDRLRRVVDLWKSKTFISTEQRDSLLQTMFDSHRPIVEPNIPPLTNPYIVNLPPPRALANMPQFPPHQPYPMGRPPIPMPPGIVPGGPIMVAPIMPKLISPKEQFGNLMNVSVGVMSNVVRQSIAAGHKKYTPIDLDTYNHTTSFVEPGRLEARVSEFYRRLEQDEERKLEESR